MSSTPFPSTVHELIAHRSPNQTVWSVYAFMKMVCLHPDIQDRVQAELDSVVGSDRLPLVTDMDDCPYTWACCLEVLRWHVVLPLGALMCCCVRGVLEGLMHLLAVPHLAMEDSFHEGYLIPRGAIIISNLWWATSEGFAKSS